MTDYMLDFETFGTGPNAVIVQIGLVKFDRYSGEVLGGFKANIDAREAVKNGAVMDADTVYWWLNQHPEARMSIQDRSYMFNEHYAFAKANDFLDGAEAIWSHATFDFNLLVNALKRLDIKPSFSYRSARDLRTLMDLARVKASGIKREGVHHDAYDDCLHQIKCVVTSMKSLNLEQETL